MKKFAELSGLPVKGKVLVDPDQVTCLSPVSREQEGEPIGTIIFLANCDAAVYVEGTPDEVYSALVEAKRLH